MENVVGRDVGGGRIWGGSVSAGHLACWEGFSCSVFCLDVLDHLMQVLADEASCADPWSRPYFVPSLDNILCSQSTTGRIRSCRTQMSLSLPQPIPAHAAKSSFKVGRQRKSASVRVALAAFSLVTPDPAIRSGPDVVLCHWLRLQASNLHDRRPGRGAGEGASHSKGAHREMVRQACLPPYASASDGAEPHPRLENVVGRDAGGRGRI